MPQLIVLKKTRGGISSEAESKKERESERKGGRGENERERSGHRPLTRGKSQGNSRGRPKTGPSVFLFCSPFLSSIALFSFLLVPPPSPFLALFAFLFWLLASNLGPFVSTPSRAYHKSLRREYFLGGRQFANQ